MMHSEKPEKLVRWYIEEVNNLIHRQCQLFPDIFRGVAGLPQNMGESPENSLAELERCVNELGFVGCLINPDPNEGEGPPPPGLGEEYWYPLYAKLVELDVPALVHSAGCRIPARAVLAALHQRGEHRDRLAAQLDCIRRLSHTETDRLCTAAAPSPIRSAGTARSGHGARRARSKTICESCTSTRACTRRSRWTCCSAGSVRTAACSAPKNPGIGTAKDPKTGEWIDDVKSKIEAIDWLSEADRTRIFEGTATEVYRLQF